ncbi:hypothetical protein [Martelella sp. HB161492]|uniref:glycine-rich domain-containing protein n=1 Tax=Martelella sp. HB161492 TaxID=2720726 RepID=UPI001590498B|nr:hypothetical protein [Martelella sp. HB161492]
MEYKPPYGSTDPDASYVDRNTPGAQKGSVPPAAAIEDPQREIVAAIEAAGLTPDGDDLTQLAQVFALSGLAHGYQGYGTAGSYSFVVPATRWYFVECYGGGGGGAMNSGGAQGEGGGGGGYACEWLLLTAGSSVSVTVGAGGSSATSGSAGGSSGGTSSFGAYLSATGGTGGTSGGYCGAGGSGAGGTINLVGQSGVDGVAGYAAAGIGGDCAGPIGGKGAQSAGSVTWPGGGGSVIANGSSSAWASSGAPGAVLIRW